MANYNTLQHTMTAAFCPSSAHVTRLSSAGTILNKAATAINWMEAFHNHPLQNFTRGFVTRLRHYSSFHNDNSDDDTNNNNKNETSQRGRDAVTLLPTYLADARAAPEHALQLGVAENYLMQEELVRHLSGLNSKIDFSADMIFYQSTQGRVGTRRAMARFMNQILSKDYVFHEDHVVIGAGCNAVLENLAFSLAEHGDSVLIPTPYYAAFEFDLVARAGLRIQPVPTFSCSEVGVEVCSSSPIPREAYYPNRASLDAAYNVAEKQFNSRPRILLLSSPNNPLGICYPASVIEECIDWAEEKGVHLISDEIYAGSVYRSTDDSAEEFVSVAEVAARKGRLLGSNIHIVYALSKDFALSGLRVGALYSENKDIALPLQKLNDLCQISSQTQVVVEHMLDPELNNDWAHDFLAESHRRLNDRCKSVETLLEELNVPFLSGEAGLFLWMDFREFLSTSGSDSEKERTLYLKLLQDYGLLFTPGLSMRTETPGFFRFVFTAASTEENFSEALRRIKQFVIEQRN